MVGWAEWGLGMGLGIKHTGDAPGEGLRGELEELLRTPGGLSIKYATYDWSLNQM